MDDNEKTRRFPSSSTPMKKVHSKPPSKDEIIRQLHIFDMDSRFGSSFGITRRERYERAKYLNLNPPVELEPHLELADVICFKEYNIFLFIEFIHLITKAFKKQILQNQILRDTLSTPKDPIFMFKNAIILWI
ncbi:hypothetical protein pb186bvf_010890 [Paramecium bursaria]